MNHHALFIAESEQMSPIHLIELMGNSPRPKFKGIVQIEASRLLARLKFVWRNTPGIIAKLVRSVSAVSATASEAVALRQGIRKSERLMALSIERNRKWKALNDRYPWSIYKGERVTTEWFSDPSNFQ